jgi:guanylate kinase
MVHIINRTPHPKLGEGLAQDTSCRGVMFVLVGPAGVGKNTIMGGVKVRLPQLEQLPTVTTRLPRPTEKEGREHVFVSGDTFQQMVTDEALIEYQEVYPGKFYGTPRSGMQAALDHGKTMIADIDVVGAGKLKAAFPDRVVLIFITPPDRDDLEERLRARGNMSEEEIATRLKRASLELSFAGQSDYRVVNDVLERSVEDVCRIIHDELIRRHCLKNPNI